MGWAGPGSVAEIVARPRRRRTPRQVPTLAGMYRHHASRPARAALFLAVSLLLVMPAAVAAHAEFERSSPADGETVQGSPRVIRAFFSEGLADGSEMALLDEAGTTIAEGTIDPANPSRMRIDPPELEPGDYEVQWKAFADDGHLETGTFTFTVSAPITPPPVLRRRHRRRQPRARRSRRLPPRPRCRPRRPWSRRARPRATRHHPRAPPARVTCSSRSSRPS